MEQGRCDNRITGNPADSSLQSWIVEEILDRMSANIYVTDIETDQILFMNKTMKQAFHIEHPEGKICWKVLQRGMKRRCEFCPVPMLCASSQETPSYIWEEDNALTGRIYENYDSLMHWVDGRVVHFQYSVDITESKRLSKEASIDELTEVWNRRAGKEMLLHSLEHSKETGGALTVCMYDINDLKQINDTFGHPTGDHLIVTIADEVKKVLGEEDFLFRLSGDEFVAVFPHGTVQEVGSRMQSALASLRALPIYPGSEQADAFCFGVLSVLPEQKLGLNDVLSAVDEKLYIQKRQLHIKRAAEKLQQKPSFSENASFTYDRERLYDALVQSTDDYIYVCNMKTGIFRYPQSMVEEFDLPSQVIENAAAVWGARVHEEDKQAFLESNQEITDGRTDCHSVEYRAKNRRGEWVWMRCRGHLERDENGEPTLFAGIITNLGKKNKIDPSTGLFNRYEFENECNHLLESHSPFALLLFGIDDLKRINNLYDREFGDEVIRITAQKIQSLLPPNSMVYRLDGDEFGVLIRNGEKEDVENLFYAVQKAFSGQQSFEGKKYFCTLSCGSVFGLRDGEIYLDLLKYANCALDYAKLRGKNRMEFFSPEIISHMGRSLEMTELLRESMENNYEGFEIYYQPIFDTKRRLSGVEALSRWRCEKYGSVSSEEFIGLMEQSGLILPFGRWVFTKAVQQCKKFFATREDFRVGINLSCLQLEEAGFIHFLQETLEREQVDPSRIILELTESNLAANSDRLFSLLQGIREMGIQVAMDDFGTGYSSLGILKQAPIDIVKIDRTFVEGIQNSTFDHSFILLTVELCHIIGLEVCLEGLETEEEFRVIQTMGINYYQGFLLGHPMPEEQVKREYLP